MWDAQTVLLKKLKIFKKKKIAGKSEEFTQNKRKTVIADVLLSFDWPVYQPLILALLLLLI